MTEYKTPLRKRISAQKYRAKRKENPQLVQVDKEYHKNYAKENKKILNEQSSRRYYTKPYERYKHRLRRLGIKIEQSLLEELSSHNGFCDICGQKDEGRWKELSIDHCHKTHTVRGMLCGKCNKAIGLFNDNPELMEKAIMYLLQHRKILELDVFK